MREEADVMQPGRGPEPSLILGALLTEPEAAARQDKAAQRRACAAYASGDAARKSAAAQAARLGYEQARHRLDPWRRRPVDLADGLVLLAVVAAAMNLLDAAELSPPLAGGRLALGTLAANAGWLTLTWLAGLAGREQRWSTVAWATGAASLLALLLAATHGSNLRGGWLTAWGQDYRNTVSGILLGLLLLALGASAAVLIARTEPASCAVARHRWRRARASYHAAWERKLAGTQAASAAAAEWLGLVRRYASQTVGADPDIVEATVTLASALLASGRPGFPPAVRLPSRPGPGASRCVRAGPGGPGGPGREGHVGATGRATLTQAGGRG